MLILFFILSILWGSLAGVIIMQFITKTTGWYTFVQIGVVVLDAFIIYHQFVNISAMIH